MWNWRLLCSYLLPFLKINIKNLTKPSRETNTTTCVKQLCRFDSSSLMHASKIHRAWRISNNLQVLLNLSCQHKQINFTTHLLICASNNHSTSAVRGTLKKQMLAMHALSLSLSLLFTFSLWITSAELLPKTVFTTT